MDYVETLRKPSTGLKQLDEFLPDQDGIVETLRKPSTGLKLGDRIRGRGRYNRRDTQKTQHGIETVLSAGFHNGSLVSRHSENPARD